MSRSDLPPRETFWTPRRARGTLIGTIVSAGVAAFWGILYGAWVIFQPYPQLMIGPIPIYLLGGVVFVLAAGWWTGRRAYMIEKGVGDPGRGLIVFFAALAVASVAVCELIRERDGARA